jgi:hypothetical protein
MNDNMKTSSEPMRSSLEIARDVPMLDIRTYLAQLGLSDDDFDSYGKFTGRDPARLKRTNTPASPTANSSLSPR